MDNTVYFAKKEDIVPDLAKKVDKYYNHIRSLGLFERMRKSYRAYYGYSTFGWKGASDSSQIVFGGEQGELAVIKVNHYRSLINSIVNLVTQNRPAMSAKATNTDYNSMASTVLANGLLEYYIKEKRLEKLLDLAVENSLIFGEGWITAEWDFSSGQPYAPNPSDPSKVIMEGDVKYRSLNPFDLIRDITVDSADALDWIIIKEMKNKFDIMEKFPEYAERILALSADDIKYLGNDTNMIRSDENDLIPIFTFWHKRSDCLPNGRAVSFVGNDIKLLDSELPYNRIPAFRITSGEIAGTPFGYSNAWDLLGMQEGMDALHTTAMSNITAFGVQNVMIPKGSGIELQSLTGGLNVVEYNSNVGKPEPLNLTATPPEVYKYMDVLRQEMETISGVNSVVRGNPEASLRSGSALAMVASQAVQSSSKLQKAYVQMLEDVGTMTIDILKEYANTKRVVSIAGKSNRPKLETFLGQDLSNISRVTVEATNSISKTTSGRLQIAEDLLNKGLIKNPDQFIQILNVGKLEPAIEGETAKMLLIRSENESFMEGKNVPVVVTEDHIMHIQEHNTVLSSPEAKLNTVVVNAVLSHIMEHLNQLRMADPDLLHILGQPSLQMMQPPPGQEMPQGGGQPKPDGGGNAAKMMDKDMGSIESQGEQVNLPKNPNTGKLYSPGQDGIG